MEKRVSSVYNLGFNESGEVHDENGADFDPAAYSRMKYGSRKDTKQFAEEITQTISQDMPSILESETPPLLLVAYKAVQPACGYLSRYSLDIINRERVERGLEPGEVVKIHKGQVTATDYARASAEEREAELTSIDFSLRGASLENTNAIILDDIRISGGAERRILSVIEALDTPPAHLMLGYVALFNPNQALQAPHVEGEINSTEIKSTQDVIQLMSEGDFDLNIRTLKMILGASRDELSAMIETAKPEYIEEILRGAIDTGPAFIQKYAPGYKFLRDAPSLRGSNALR